MNKWLEKYSNGDIVQQNYNDVSVSLPEGFVGMGYNTKGRNYSPAWGGQFQDGGEIAQTGKTVPFEQWYKTVPKAKNDTTSYNLRRAYDLAPQKELDAFVKNPKAHLMSVYEDPNTGIYEFMKSKNHSTIQKELDFYNSKKGTDFRNSYDLDTTNDFYRYVPKKEMAMGGSLPGAVGFTYARTNNPAPSNGKYAKKTMPSAQDGWVTKAANAEFSCAANPRSNLNQSYSEYCNPKKGLDKDEYKALKNELSIGSMKDLLNVEEYYVLKNLADNQNRKMGREDNAYSKYFDQSTGLPISNLTNELKEEGNLRATNRMYPGRKNLLVNDVYQGILKDYNITTPQTPAQTKALLEKAYNIGYSIPKQQDGGNVAQRGKSIPVPTTADSVRLFNAQMALNNFYAKEIKAGRIKSTETKIMAGNSYYSFSNIFRELNEDNLKFYREKIKERVKYSGSGINDKYYKNYFNLSPEKVHKLEYEGLGKTKSGSEYQQYYRDFITPMQNLASPFALIDSRILPQKVISYEPIDRAKTYPGGSVMVYDYDPLAIKPYQMRTDKEKIEWEKKYGKGTPTKKSKTEPEKKKPVVNNVYKEGKAELLKLDRKAFTSGLVGQQRPDVQLPTIQNLPYRVEYYDGDINGMTHKNFIDEKAGSEFMKELQNRSYGIPYGVQAYYENTPKKENGGWLEKYQGGGEEPLTKSSADWYKQWYEQRQALPQFSRVAGERLKLLSTLPKVQLSPLEELHKFGAVGEYIKNRGDDASQDIINLADPATVPAFAKKEGKSIDVNIGTDPSVVGHEMSHWFDARAKQYMFKPRDSKSEPYEKYPFIKPTKFKKSGLDGKTYSWISDDDNPEFATGVKTEVNSVLNELRQKEGLRGDQSTTPEQLQKIIDKYMNLSEDELRGGSPKGSQNQRIRTLIKYMGGDPKKLSELNNTIVTIQKEDVPIAKQGGLVRAQGGYQTEKKYPIDLHLPKYKKPKPFFTGYGFSVRPEPNVNVYGVGASGSGNLNDRLNLSGSVNSASEFYPGGNKMFMNPRFEVGMKYKFDDGGWLSKFDGGGVTGDPNKPYDVNTNPEGYFYTSSGLKVHGKSKIQQGKEKKQVQAIKKYAATIPQTTVQNTINPNIKFNFPIANDSNSDLARKNELLEKFTTQTQATIADFKKANPWAANLNGNEVLNRLQMTQSAFQNQGTIKKAGPEEGILSRAWNIASNPMTALSYAIHKQDIPEHFERGEKNILDHAVNIINPATYINSGASIGNALLHPWETTKTLSKAGVNLLTNFTDNTNVFNDESNSEALELLGDVGNMFMLGETGAFKPLQKVYNEVATGNSALPLAWKLEKPTGLMSGATENSRNYIARTYTNREAELLSKYGKGMEFTPDEWAEMQALTKSGATDFSKSDIPISRIPLYYSRSEQAVNEADAFNKLRLWQKFSTPSEKNIRTWSAGIPEGYSPERLARSRPVEKTRLVIPSKYTKGLEDDFAAMPYDDTRVDFIYPKGGGFNKFASEENELMGNIPEGFRKIGSSNEGGYNNIIIKPIGKKSKELTKQLPGSTNAASSVDDVGKGLTQTSKPTWQMQEMPGLHLKSTMEGQAISKIVEPKTGLVNVEQALGIIGKESGGAEKVAMIRKGLGDKISQKMDYNEFRKTIQDQLIPLERQFSEQASNYGIGKLGYPFPKRSSYEKAIRANKEEITRLETTLKYNGNIEPTSWETVDQIRDRLKIQLDDNKLKLLKSEKEFATLPLENQTLILGNKSKFGRGSNAHGNPDETLGHAHFLRDAETPDVLTVTQIQSDAFQGTHRIMPKNALDASKVEKSLQRMQEIQERNKSVLNKMKTEGLDEAGLPVHPYQIKQFEDIVKGQETQNIMKKAEFESYTQKQLLDKNHQERYLQELVDYAGKRGDVNKVRVPTSETAAKVQGYSKVEKSTDPNFINPLPQNATDAQRIAWDKHINAIRTGDKSGLKINYSSEHQTILKKYSEQPKTIKKLFGEEPKIVTDSKGNTWYEFGIPETFKQGKGQIRAFKQGGIIKDDRGQWDHPGKITRIKGGNITMKPDPKTGKALTEPLLGISNTGERKMMYPGQDYQFEDDTEYVTEYPIAKNGVRQEQKGLQNLDDLLNFTNYNKPQPDRWLNKYN